MGRVMNYGVDVALVLDFGGDEPPTDQEVVEAVVETLRLRLAQGIIDGCLTIIPGDDKQEGDCFHSPCSCQLPTRPKDHGEV